jgi:hypothetical protein
VGQVAEQVLLFVTDPRHVAVRPEQRLKNVKLLPFRYLRLAGRRMRVRAE